MKLHISQLEKLLLNEDISMSLKKIAQALIWAINDWPNPTNTLDGYLMEIQHAIGCIPDKKQLENYLSSLNLTKDAWKAESINQLIEIYDFYPANTLLTTIISAIKIEAARRSI